MITKCVQIFDDGPQYTDQYTVIIDQDVFAMSANADQPNGFNQYIGEINPESTYGVPLVIDDSLPIGLLNAINLRATE